jgi:hypothetical protein
MYDDTENAKRRIKPDEATWNETEADLFHRPGESLFSEWNIYCY